MRRPGGKKKGLDPLDLLCDIGELAALLSGSENIESFLQHTVALVSRHLGADVCSIYLFDEQSKELVLKATIGLNPRAVDRIRMKPGEGLVGTTLKEMKPILEASAGGNPRFKYFEEADEERFESFLSVPVQRGVEKIGVLVVQHEAPDYFDQTDVRTLRATASQLSGAIENARLLMGLNRISAKPQAPPSWKVFRLSKAGLLPVGLHMHRQRCWKEAMESWPISIPNRITCLHWKICTARFKPPPTS